MKLIPFQLEEGCSEGYRQMYINLEELARMEKASYLLPDPGGEVVRSLIAESRRFRLIGVRILKDGINKG